LPAHFIGKSGQNHRLSHNSIAVKS
jgi:hypothetical protein